MEVLGEPGQFRQFGSFVATLAGKVHGNGCLAFCIQCNIVTFCGEHIGFGVGIDAENVGLYITLVRAKWLASVEERLASGEWRMANSQSPTPNPDDLVETDWDTALDLVANRFAEIKKEHGSDAFALMASAKCTNGS